jgi:hypothetical protein
MPREVKHSRRAFLEEATPTATLVAAHRLGSDALSFSHAGSHGNARVITARWFAALDPAAEAPAEPSRPTAVAAAPLVVAALGALALLHGMVLHTLLPVALLLVAAVVMARWARARARSGAPRQAAGQGTEGMGRGIELDRERLAFHSGHRPAPPPVSRPGRGPDGATLLRIDGPFGVTLLASPRRDRLIALLSSAAGTFYLGAAFDAAARRAFAPLLDRSFTVLGDDAGMEAIGPDGEPLVLAPDELASLLDALVEQSPTCLDRFVLTDARGATLTLDGRSLCVGERAVDLNAPLEWKSIVFQEAFGQMIAVYQGTWIRQSSTELTLVSLLPALGPAPGADLDLGSLDRAVLRDLRLMQSSPEAPPPSEQRVAIDRLFMLPVRSALDRAPRASHQPDRAQA